MSLVVLRPREASVLAALADAAVAPQGDLPPVRETTAIAAIDDLLRRVPGTHRLGIRGAAYALELLPLLTGRGHRFRRLPRTERGAVLARLEAAPAGRLLFAVRSLVVMAYYGDERVLRARGYDPEQNLDRARAARTAGNRW